MDGRADRSYKGKSKTSSGLPGLELSSKNENPFKKRLKQIRTMKEEIKQYEKRLETYVADNLTKERQIGHLVEHLDNMKEINEELRVTMEREEKDDNKVKRKSKTKEGEIQKIRSENTNQVDDNDSYSDQEGDSDSEVDMTITCKNTDKKEDEAEQNTRSNIRKGQGSRAHLSAEVEDRNEESHEDESESEDEENEIDEDDQIWKQQVSEKNRRKKQKEKDSRRVEREQDAKEHKKGGEGRRTIIIPNLPKEINKRDIWESVSRIEELDNEDEIIIRGRDSWNRVAILKTVVEKSENLLKRGNFRLRGRDLAFTRTEQAKRNKEKQCWEDTRGDCEYGK